MVFPSGALCGRLTALYPHPGTRCRGYRHSVSDGHGARFRCLFCPGGAVPASQSLERPVVDVERIDRVVQFWINVFSDLEQFLQHAVQH